MESYDSMKDITEDVITFYSAKDLANDLNISPVTLKKHSLLIEKLSEGGVLFKRNDDKSRIYTDTDVLLIRRTLDLRDKEGMTYENAVINVLQEEKILDVPPVPNDRTPAVPSDFDFNRTAEAFFAVLNEQNDRIDRLIEANEALVKTNKEQSEQIQQLLDHNQKQNALLLEKIEELPSEKEDGEPKKEPPSKKAWWQFWR